MLLISESQLKQALRMEDAIQAVKAAFRDYSLGLVHVPGRVSMNIRGAANSSIFLAANYLSIPYYGVKHACSFPGNKEKGLDTVISDIHLYSAETGKLLAMISANYLTAIKTGAAAAVATDILARKGVTTLAIFGTGVQARTQLEAIQQVRPIGHLKLFDTSQLRARDFLQYVETVRNGDFPVTVCKSAAECVSGSEVICTTTTSLTPVFSGDCLSDGVHINAIGSFTPAMQEIDSQTVVRAGKIVTDNRDETWAVAGDLLVPLSEGAITRSRIYGELGDIVSGKIPGRENDEEITIYESVGFAALDIAVAVAAFEKARAAGLGTAIEWSDRRMM